MRRLLGAARDLYGNLTAEGRALFVLMALAGATGTEVRTGQIYLVWCALAGVLLASLVLRPRVRLEGVRVEVEVARRVTAGEPIRFALRLTNPGPRPHQAVHLVMPALAHGGRYEVVPPPVASLPAGGSARVAFVARLPRRGQYVLEGFSARGLVPLGLALGPPAKGERCRVLVVPRVANVARLRTPMGQRYQPGGVALASKTGESMELLGVRPYRAGDPVRDLHAKSWARTGIPVVREFQQEYFSRIGVVLDTDEHACTPAQLEAAISLAAGVVANLSRGESLIDLLVVGDHVHPLTLGRSLGFLEQALDLLACVTPGPALEADAMVTRLRPFLGRLSCVVLVVVAWDEARKALAHQIRSHGIGCRVLLVEPDGAAARPAGGADLSALTVASIAGGEPLAL